jgi:uncharacterized protein YaeQ
VIAYLLEYRDGIEFSRGGISAPEDPAIAVRDLTGRITSWIDIGTPDAARLHKASKAAARVAVYTHKDPAQLLRRLAGEKIHRGGDLEIYALDRALVAALAARLDRRMSFTATIAAGEIFVSIGSDTISGAVTGHRLAD